MLTARTMTIARLSWFCRATEIRWTLVIAGLAAAAAAGCSEKAPPAPPQVVPLTGTLRYKGQVVPRARLTLHGGQVAEPAFAITDARGRFTAMTNDTIGIPPGEYRITVSSRVVKVPPRYADPQSTPLRISVDLQKSHELALTLEE